MGLLEGRVALVVGASSGIGGATARALAEAGAAVAVSARRADRLEALVREIEGTGGKALAIPGDACDSSFATCMVGEVVERLGRLDILVNSAGIIRPGGVHGADLEEWKQVIDVNLMATLYASRAALDVMIAQGRGDIVNVSSTAGRRATGHFGPYATSKFGLTGLSEGMRQEVGAKGVRVCLIEPGATATEVAESIPDPGVRQFMHDHVHREGAMEAEDVAAAIVFVCALPPRANVSEILIRPTSDVAPL